MEKESSLPLEIERKYLIRMPDPVLLDRLCAERWEITQFYTADGLRGREIRRGDRVAWVETRKERLSDLVRAEVERELTREEYDALLARRDPKRRVLEKTRWRIPWAGQLLEVDVFPFWNDRAFCEVELSSPDQSVTLPDWLTLIREVTHEHRYTNKSLTKRIPREKLGAE